MPACAQVPTSDLTLSETALALSTGAKGLGGFISELCDRIDRWEPEVQALLPEGGRRDRLLREAAGLLDRYPEPTQRPLLFGVPVGIKDIIKVDGFPTRAGSRLPPELFDGRQAEVVTRLLEAGAMVLGKTVTTEFAYFEPGPTRNPRRFSHTPGGSSSGSAAAVAAGFCPLALGSQTVGSVIRPAAFCGVVGFKPSSGRIPLQGVVPYSPTADQLGLFTPDLRGMKLAASALCSQWREELTSQPAAPVIGVPHEAYLEQASGSALSHYRDLLRHFETTGIRVVETSLLEDIADVNRRHERLISGEMARVHETWFTKYADLYRPRTREQIESGRRVSDLELEGDRGHALEFREAVALESQRLGVDIWLSPAAADSASEGLGSTGDPVMNLPWTHAGVPAVSLPAGVCGNGMPLGLQGAAPHLRDEDLLAWAEKLQRRLPHYESPVRGTD